MFTTIINPKDTNDRNDRIFDALVEKAEAFNGALAVSDLNGAIDASIKIAGLVHQFYKTADRYLDVIEIRNMCAGNKGTYIVYINVNGREAVY